MGPKMVKAENEARTRAPHMRTIFGGRAVFEDKWEQKLVARRVMSVATYDDPVVDPKYLDWSKHPITFSRADQWSDIPYIGHFPLVLDPIIKDVRF